MPASLYNDIKRLRKLAKHAWILGMALGLLCHFLPPEYQEACHAVVKACTP